MYNSLACVVSSDVDSEDYGDLFGTVCGLGDGVCVGITANASTGTYGAYGMCNSTEQLAYVMNNYYEAQENSPSACDFSGSATTKPTTSLNNNCQALVSEAGSEGTGTVTTQPTGTGVGSAGGSGDESDSDSSESSGAAGILGVPTYSTGLVQFGAYVVVAVGTGMGMILL